MKKLLSLTFLSCFLFSCTDETKTPETKKKEFASSNTVPEINYTVVNALPHDTTSYTEGFLFCNGQLFESSGAPSQVLYAKSILGIVDIKTGKIDKKAELDRSVYFGEGIVILKNKIYQLTYKNQIGFIYDAKTFKKIGQFNYQNEEGWGLTTDGTNIIMSDGTNVLTYLDPTTFKVIKTLNVSENGFAKDNLNELEYIKGFIYANVWTTNHIVKIDPATGKVIGKLDLTALNYKAKNIKITSETMNGIAYDSISNKIYVTGKLWPNTYQIDFPH